MYTVIVNPVHGEQMISHYQFFSEAYAALDKLTVAFFVDGNLKSIEMRCSYETV